MLEAGAARWRASRPARRGNGARACMATAAVVVARWINSDGSIQRTDGLADVAAAAAAKRRFAAAKRLPSLSPASAVAVTRAPVCLCALIDSRFGSWLVLAKRGLAM